jgi:periplasmic protein TonB
MNAHFLHLPDNRGIARWLFAGLAILIAHAAIIAAVAVGYARQSVETTILPAIAVTLAPIQSSSPEVQQEDIPIGPAMQQADEAPKEPPKVEEKPTEDVMQPTPPQQAEVTLPEVQQKVEQPKPEVMPPAPETRAPPKSEHVAQFTELGHLRRFHRYPRAAHGASGQVTLRFALDRAGRVIESVVTKSSGSRVLDQDALDTLQRANPFPPFPAAKPGNQYSNVIPLDFGRSD